MIFNLNLPDIQEIGLIYLYSDILQFVIKHYYQDQFGGIHTKTDIRSF